MKMKMFRLDHRKESNRMFHLSLPRMLMNYLSLYCLAKKRTKTSIILGLLSAWHEQVKIREPQEKLVQDIVLLVHEGWKEEQVKFPEKILSVYKVELEKELRWRGLNPMQTSIILKALQ